MRSTSSITIIAGCKKQQETADAAAAQQACLYALHDFAPTKAVAKQNKRVRAAAKQSIPRKQRTEANVDALLEKAAMAPPAAFAKLFNEVEAE